MELYEHPANLFVAGFIGSPKMNVLPSRADGAAIAIENAGRIAWPRTAPAHVTYVGFRPENISLVSEELGHLRGTVEVVERLGSDTFAYVAVDRLAAVTVRAVGNVASMKAGQKVGLALDLNRLHLFAADGTTILTT